MASQLKTPSSSLSYRLCGHVTPCLPMGSEQKVYKQLAVHALKKVGLCLPPSSSPFLLTEMWIWRQQLERDSLALRWKLSVEDAKTESEQNGLNTVKLPSGLRTGDVQIVSWERNKCLPLLSHSYFDFCYNSQTCLLMNTSVHCYTHCAMRIWDSKDK